MKIMKFFIMCMVLSWNAKAVCIALREAEGLGYYTGHKDRVRIVDKMSGNSRSQHVSRPASFGRSHSFKCSPRRLSP